jgi:hypothetical protein
MHKKKQFFLKTIGKKPKIARFKANFRLLEGDNCAQIIPIYKAKTFICKNMCYVDCPHIVDYFVAD